EGAHAGSSGGLDSISTVFDDRTARGVDSHAIRGVKEEIRSWLAPGDFAGTEDPADEAAVEPGQPQGVANPLVATARRDAGRGGDSVERLENPRHRLELGFESRPIQMLKGLVPVRRKRAAEVRLDLRRHVFIGPAHEPLDHFRLGHRPAKLREYG